MGGVGVAAHPAHLVEDVPGDEAYPPTKFQPDRVHGCAVHALHTDRQTDRQRDRQTDRQADRQTDRQTDRCTDRLLGRGSDARKAQSHGWLCRGSKTVLQNLPCAC